MKNHKTVKKSFAQHGPVPSSSRYQYLELWLFWIWFQKLWYHADVVLTLCFDAFRACKVTIHFNVPGLAKVPFSTNYI